MSDQNLPAAAAGPQPCYDLRPPAECLNHETSAIRSGESRWCTNCGAIQFPGMEWKIPTVMFYRPPENDDAALNASPRPCKIFGSPQLDRLVVKYLGGSRENITRDEIEILLFALYNESKARGGIASTGYAEMERRLRLQGALASATPQATPHSSLGEASDV